MPPALPRARLLRTAWIAVLACVSGCSFVPDVGLEPGSSVLLWAQGPRSNHEHERLRKLYPHVRPAPAWLADRFAVAVARDRDPAAAPGGVTLVSWDRALTRDASPELDGRTALDPELARALAGTGAARVLAVAVFVGSSQWFEGTDRAPIAEPTPEVNLAVAARYVVYELPSGRPLRTGSSVKNAVGLEVDGASLSEPAVDQVVSPGTPVGAYAATLCDVLAARFVKALGR